MNWFNVAKTLRLAARLGGVFYPAAQNRLRFKCF